MRDELLNVLTAAIEVMGGKISGPALTVYADELQALPLDDVRQALRRCVREIKLEYGHTLALKDILDRCNVLTPQQQISAEADRWWSRIPECFYKCADCPEEHISHGKRDLLMEAAPPAFHHAIRICGGWNRIINTPAEYYGHLRRDFIEAFKNYDVSLQSELMLPRRSETHRGLESVAAIVKSLPERK